MDKRIILNRIKTPDGTILTSYSVHDYKTYIDKNGLEYMVDGGNEYLRRNVYRDKWDRKGVWPFIVRLLIRFGWYNSPGPNVQYEEMSIYSDAPFEVVRKSFHRGGRGVDGKQPLTWVLLCDMSDEWLKATIKYLKINRASYRNEKNSGIGNLYQRELDYRKENNISVPE